MAVHFAITTGSNTPIYRQISDQLRHAVATGKLRAEDQLPSVRALAEDLVLNPNTVARAYAELAREGVLEPRPGRGVFIVQKRKVFSREEGRRQLEPLIDGLIGKAMATDFMPDELKALFEKRLRQWKHQKGGS